MVDSIYSLRDTLSDSFTVLPLLFMGLIFFLGILTSNIGMLYLFLGELILVPALSFAANVPGGVISYFTNGLFLAGAKWIVTIVAILTTASLALVSKAGSSGFSIYIGIIWTALLQFFNGDFTILDTYDPYRWYLTATGAPPSTKAPPACGLMPGLEDEKWTSESRVSPTSWLIHITFFFGFILSNAIATYNEPTPTIRSTNDSTKDGQRQAALDARVANRKTLCATIGVVSMFILLVLLYIRIAKTPCEGEVGPLFFPLLWTFLLGYGWFSLIYTHCGIRPGDVLGIVQGFVTPDMVDNPIVCLGSE
jgi:hypothetical protein